MEFTIRDYLKIVFRRKYTVIATVILVVFVVLVGLQFKTPEYEAKVKMFILGKKQIDSPFYKDMSEFRSSEITLTQSEIVKSNPVLERVVTQLDLAKNSIETEKKAASPLMAILMDLNNKKEQASLDKLTEEEKSEFLNRKALLTLKKQVIVEPMKDTDLFIITVKNSNPQEAAKIANMISRSYCIFDLEQQLAEILQKYGDKHLYVIQLKDTLEQLQNNLKSTTLSNIDAIGPASVKIIEQATVPIEPIGISNTIIIIVAFLMSIILGIVLAAMFEYMDSSLKSPEEVKSFLSNINFLGYVPHVVSFPGKILQTIAKINIIYCIYIFCISLFRLAGDLLGVDPENVIIKFATQTTQIYLRHSSDSSKEAIIVNYLIFFVVLIAFAIGFSKLLFFLAKTLSKRKIMLNIKKKKINSYFQIYQNLSEQIYLTMKSNEQKSFLVTSSVAQEGTSTIIANIATYLANKTGNKVLVIDANFRKSKIHKIFKVEAKPGLLDVLKGDAKIEDAIENVDDNLSVLPAGNVSLDSIALLNPEKMTNIIKEAEKKFDLIIIDCANLKSCKDAVAFSSYVDGIVLVINEGKTRKEVLKSAIAPLEHKKAHFIGTILNNRTFAIPHIIYERS